MPAKRAKASFICVSGTGKRQADFSTPMAVGDINARLPDTAQGFYRKEQTRTDIPDCTGQELYKRILTGEIGDISVEFNATAKLLARLAAYAMGVATAPAPAGADQSHALSELPTDEFQPPPFSMVFGFEGGATPLLLRSCVVNSLGVTGRARQIVTGRANIKFAEAVEAAGFVLPACVNEMPLRFVDCDLTVAGVSQEGLLRSFEFNYNNRILTDDHAHTDESIHATRLERDDQRERTLSYAVLGDNSDQAYLDAEAGAEKSFALRLGGAAAHRITFSAPLAHHVLDGGGLRKDGRVGETNIAVVATPMITNQMPLSAVAVNDQATAYLLV